MAVADRQTCERIATELRKAGRDNPYWYLAETVGALLDAGIIAPGPALGQDTAKGGSDAH
jgi:hypothetical protein